MKTLLAGMLIFVGSIPTFADGQVDGDPDPGAFWLSRIELQGNVLVLTRSDQNFSFSFQFEKNTPKPSPAGSVWRLPLGVAGRFFGFESSLRFVPFPKSSLNLFLTEATNRRGDVHVGLLRRSSTNQSPREMEVDYIRIKPLPVSVSSFAKLAQIEKDVQTGNLAP
jgi:hypothetical protein